MDEDNILGLSVLVGIFGIVICCGAIIICRNFTCRDNQIIINPDNLLDDQSDSTVKFQSNSLHGRN
jgi:hypothetical protein